MSLRKILTICVVVAVTVLPLAGCSGDTAGEGGGSNTTDAAATE